MTNFVKLLEHHATGSYPVLVLLNLHSWKTTWRHCEIIKWEQHFVCSM